MCPTGIVFTKIASTKYFRPIVLTNIFFNKPQQSLILLFTNRIAPCFTASSKHKLIWIFFNSFSQIKNYQLQVFQNNKLVKSLYNLVLSDLFMFFKTKLKRSLLFVFWFISLKFRFFIEIILEKLFETMRTDQFGDKFC